MLLNNRQIKSNTQALSYLISQFADEIYAGRQKPISPILCFFDLMQPFLTSHTISTPDYQLPLCLTQITRKKVADQSDCTKSMLATPVNTVMSLGGAGSERAGDEGRQIRKLREKKKGKRERYKAKVREMIMGDVWRWGISQSVLENIGNEFEAVIALLGSKEQNCPKCEVIKIK